MVRIVFSDKDVCYDDFLNDLADRLTPRIKEAILEPNDTISQNKAFSRYGKANVLRWVKQGLLTPFAKRPGRIDYKVIDLKLCHNRHQDYFV